MARAGNLGCSARGPVLFLALCAIAAPRAIAGKETPRGPAAPAGTGHYVGSESCRECHSDLYKPFESTAHWKTILDTRRGPAFQGCESCHGPGEEHVNSGGDPEKIIRFSGLSASKVSERCLFCHVYGEEHSNFLRSAHKTSNVSCLDCHSPHHAAESQFLLRASQPEVCYRCHADNKADFRKPFHHRVEEKLLRCTDCHNQHGGFLDKQLRSASSQEQVCGRCHIEQTGPFTFEHAPVRTEGCTVCHAAHGAANARMLKRAQVNLLCLECHTFTTGSKVRGTPPFHNQAERYQACTLCHTAIHGSNFSRTFLE